LIVPFGMTKVRTCTRTPKASARFAAAHTNNPQFESSPNEKFLLFRQRAKVEVTEGGQSEYVTLGESDSVIQDAVIFVSNVTKKKKALVQRVVAVLIVLHC